MQFPNPLVPATLLRRYKRFLADVRLPDGTLATAHCPNPGSMLGLAEPGTEVWLEDRRDGRGKLDWGWELSCPPGTAVGINAARANGIASEALDAPGLLPELEGYARRRREVAYGRASRVDFLLCGDGRPDCYLEVKSVTLRRPGGAHPDAAEFPDAVTARGARHLEELSAVRAAGGRAVMLYLVQRDDCDHFRVAGDIDPTYAAAFRQAIDRGVEMLCVWASVAPGGIAVAGRLPVMV